MLSTLSPPQDLLQTKISSRTNEADLWRLRDQQQEARNDRDRLWLIRLPRGLQEEIYAVDETTSELGAELHRSPTPGEIEKRGNLEAGAAGRASAGKSSRNPKSLDSEGPDDGLASSEKIGFDDPRYGEIGANDEIAWALQHLDSSERLILRLRFTEEMTQKAIAERIGCSQMHISRTIRRSLDKMEEQISQQV